MTFVLIAWMWNMTTCCAIWNTSCFVLAYRPMCHNSWYFTKMWYATNITVVFLIVWHPQDGTGCGLSNNPDYQTLPILRYVTEGSVFFTTFRKCAFVRYFHFIIKILHFCHYRPSHTFSFGIHCCKPLTILFPSIHGITAPSRPWPPSKVASILPYFPLFSSILASLISVMRPSTQHPPIWFLVFPLVLCYGISVQNLFWNFPSSILLTINSCNHLRNY
jgi:hypothetical protein